MVRPLNKRVYLKQNSLSGHWPLVNFEIYNMFQYDYNKQVTKV